MSPKQLELTIVNILNECKALATTPDVEAAELLGNRWEALCDQEGHQYRSLPLEVRGMADDIEDVLEYLEAGEVVEISPRFV